ncbi:hypothetical protein [Cryptosporangium phraense]|uniref:Uncharacterized protein n=1 Tax=Cryptosporangium phraense TaxID=2593070 RepID=A0A545ASA3_9ACTN|nr:hypothetical protein [Cryptosporangium phraense]TQS44210.1 hypothetical protein FL583_14795 [Cryptosporangium phraense]
MTVVQVLAVLGTVLIACCEEFGRPITIVAGSVVIAQIAEIVARVQAARDDPEVIREPASPPCRSRPSGAGRG